MYCVHCLFIGPFCLLGLLFRLYLQALNSENILFSRSRPTLQLGRASAGIQDCITKSHRARDAASVITIRSNVERPSCSADMAPVWGSIDLHPGLGCVCCRCWRAVLWQCGAVRCRPDALRHGVCRHVEVMQQICCTANYLPTVWPRMLSASGPASDV